MNSKEHGSSDFVVYFIMLSGFRHATNGKMDEWGKEKDMRGSGRGHSKHYPSVCLVGLMKTKKHL
jgi:hypothetical protein